VCREQNEDDPEDKSIKNFLSKEVQIETCSFTTCLFISNRIMRTEIFN
jgi:hypothetical protein